MSELNVVKLADDVKNVVTSLGTAWDTIKKRITEVEGMCSIQSRSAVRIETELQKNIRALSDRFNILRGCLEDPAKGGLKKLEKFIENTIYKNIIITEDRIRNSFKADFSNLYTSVNDRIKDIKDIKSLIQTLLQRVAFIESELNKKKLCECPPKSKKLKGNPRDKSGKFISKNISDTKYEETQLGSVDISRTDELLRIIKDQTYIYNTRNLPDTLLIHTMLNFLKDIPNIYKQL